MGRATAIFIGILILALLAGGLTEVALAVGGRGMLANDVLSRPKTQAKTTPAPSSSVTPAATPVTTPTPTPTPAAATAITNSFVHLRAAASTSSNILTDLNGGTVVQLLPYVDPEWQQVQYNGFTGYIFKSYLNY